MRIVNSCSYRRTYRQNVTLLRCPWRSEAKPIITSQEGASNSPPFDEFVEPPRERGGFVKVGQETSY